MIKLSVIVPMYNVEPYVERCIRSLEEQDIPRDEYEIICINDGSPDNSREIVNELQKEFSNIKLIDQENQGVSRARNSGIKKATGSYLLFIDPDDYVNSNSFNRILLLSDANSAEVVFLGFAYHNLKGAVVREFFYDDYKDEVYKGIDAYYMVRGYASKDPDRTWAILFKRDFILANDLFYLPGVPYLEDGELISRILCLAKRCVFDSNGFYQRTTRIGSATNSNLFFTDRALSGFFKAANNLNIFKEEKELTEEQKVFLNQPICKFVFLSSAGALIKPYCRNFKTTKNVLLEAGLNSLDKNGVAKPYYWYVPIYNFSPLIFLLITRTKMFRLILRIIFRKSILL